MKQARYPNRLKSLVKEAGLNIREVHQETKIPESTLHYWAAGYGVIPKKDRAVLAQVIGCSVIDLAPNHAEEMVDVAGSSFTNEAPKRLVGTAGSLTKEEGRIIVGIMHGKEMNGLHTSHGLSSLASQNALNLMQQADVDCFAVDDLIILTQSSGFVGWDRDDVFITPLTTPLPVPRISKCSGKRSSRLFNKISSTPLTIGSPPTPRRSATDEVWKSLLLLWDFMTSLPLFLFSMSHC